MKCDFEGSGYKLRKELEVLHSFSLPKGKLLNSGGIV